MQHLRSLLALAIVTCAASGCAGNGEGLDVNGRPQGNNAPPPASPAITFASIQSTVFTPLCVGCHAGATAPRGLRLEQGVSYAMLVGTASSQVPSLQRVKPGDPNNSYLIQKLEGTAAVGRRMPLNQPPVPQDTINSIRQWIAEGAPPPPATTGVPSKLAAVTPVPGATLATSPREIVLIADGELDASLVHSDNVVLHASGGDGTFGDGNETQINAVQVTLRSLEPSIIAVQPLAPAHLPADTYELRVRSSAPAELADRAAVLIDGDANGTPGGDFTLRFAIGVQQ